MPFKRIAGVTLHFEAQAAEPGRPFVVFINSLGTDLRIWNGVRSALPGIAALAYDVRGHGLSDYAAAPQGIDDYVEELEGLLDWLDISHAVICGVSLGGLIAQGLCRSRPERVRGLVLSNTGLSIGDAGFWDARIDMVQREGIAAIADAVVPRWFSPHFVQSGAAELAGYANMLTRQPPAGYMAACAAIRDADFTASAAGIRVPTLCISSDSDLATPPAVVEALAAAIPGARLRQIQGGGHLPMIERPLSFAALLEDFLSTLPAENRR